MQAKLFLLKLLSWWKLVSEGFAHFFSWYLKTRAQKMLVKQKPNSTSAISELKFPSQIELLAIRLLSKGEKMAWIRERGRRCFTSSPWSLCKVPEQHRRAWKAPVWLQDTEGLFSGAQSSKVDGDKSFCTAVCRPQSSPHIILCFSVVFSQYKLVTRGYCWVSGATPDVLISPTAALVFAGILYSQSLPSFDRSLNLLFLNGCCLLPDLFPFVLRTLSAELPPKQPLNEGKHLKLSIWIFR